jgi:hypothetical protein
MAALSADYTGCDVLIYDIDENFLNCTTIETYDKDLMWINVRQLNSALKFGDICRILVLSSPLPHEYQGTVVKNGIHITIAIYRGKERKMRSDRRYAITMPARIEKLIYNGKAHPLQNAVVICLINISKNGVRFRAPYNALSVSDTFIMCLRINNKDKFLKTLVINCKEVDSAYSEYGCRLKSIVEKDA